MRLKLSNAGDVAVLEVLEEVTVENTSVLRAGVGKLLKSGKNKIVVNLIDTKQLAMDVVREIIKLHLVATELKGEIVLVGHGDLVKQAIKSFANPPPIKYFATLDAAVRSFVQASESAPEASGNVDPATADLKGQIKKLEAENTALKGKLANRNVDDLKKLRFENSVFQQQLVAMEEQLRNLVKERKKPFELDALNTKVKQLETALSEFLEKDGLVSTKG